MSKFDLRSDKTEYLSNDEVFDYFVPFKPDFNSVTKIKSTYFVGHKGSGKSFLLKYLSLSLQLKRYDEKSIIDYDEKAIGIFVQCNVGRFGNFREIPSESLSEDWIKVFTHAFNLSVLEVFLESINKLKLKKQNISDNELDAFLNSVIKLLRIEVGDTTLENVLDMVDEELNLIQEESQLEITLNSDRFYSQATFLHELRKRFQKYFSNYVEIEPVFLLDEYNELSNGQQKIINEMIHIRQPIFKMSCLPKSYIKDRVYDGQNDIGDDYDIVYLANKPLTPKSLELSKIMDFMIEISTKRLEKFTSAKIINLLESPKKFTPTSEKVTKTIYRKINIEQYCGLTNYVVLSSGNPKTFLDLIQNTVDRAVDKGIDISNTPIPTSIQLDSVMDYSIKRRKEVVLSDTSFGRILVRLVEYIGKYLYNKTVTTGDHYRFVSITDSSKLSELASNAIELALKNAVMTQNDLGRVSKNEKIRLDVLSLNNYLLPSFMIPLSSHQNWEITSNIIEKALTPDLSTIDDEIKKAEKKEESTFGSHPNMEDYTLLGEINELIQKKELILFIGSGFSTQAGVKSGAQIIQKISNILDIKKSLAFETACGYFTFTNGNEGLIDFLKSELEYPEKLHMELHDKLLGLDVKIFVTTNYDDLVEGVLHKLKKSPQIIVNKDEIQLYKEDNNVVFKIHGDFNHRTYIVATEKHYDKYLTTHDFMLTRLKSLLQNKSVFFLGYSLCDRNFNLIRQLVDSELGTLRKSYALFPEIDKYEKTALAEKHIHVISTDFATAINYLVK